jgi:peptidoglycan lytic transglycosylase
MNYALVTSSIPPSSARSLTKSDRIDWVRAVLAAATLISLCLLFSAGRCYAAGDQSVKIAVSDIAPSFGPWPRAPGISLSDGDEYGQPVGHDLAAVAAFKMIPKELPTAAAPLTGLASWYNPYLEASHSETRETETASGEQYDPDKWTGAIQIDLRAQFGGVEYGKDYAATYALIEYGDRQAIVKINDVGPLAPGRVIDLSERAMRYFDPSLQVGLLSAVQVTPLPGDRWKAGPVAREHVPSRWAGPSYFDEIRS